MDTIIEPKKEPVEKFPEVEGKNVEKTEKLSKISKGNFDFSKRKDLDNITLSDDTDLKKEKEKEEMIGRDIVLDE